MNVAAVLAALAPLVCNPAFGIDREKFFTEYLKAHRSYARWSYSLRRYQGRMYIAKGTSINGAGQVYDRRHLVIGRTMGVIKNDEDLLQTCFSCVERIEPGWWMRDVR